MRELEPRLNLKPQVNLSRATALRMWLVCICAGIAIIQSAWTDRGSSLEIAVIALGSAVFVELLVFYRARAQGGGRGDRIADGSAAASALVFSLLLPSTIHPVYAGFGAGFAMLVIKHSFGGLGSNWANPALGGWLFVRFSWPQVFERALAGSPSGGLNPGGETGLDAAVRSFLNDRVFFLTGSELPGGYIDLLFSGAPGIIADRGLCALLLGTIILIASQTNRAWIPAAYLGVYALLIRCFGALAAGGAFGEGDILFAFFSGGTIAAAFLLMADPATGAKSDLGMFAAVILGAVFSFIFRYSGGEIYGAFFAVALVNALTPLIRSIESRQLYSQAGNGRARKGT
ncbi:electron transport complex subunit D [Spirochaetia bacterium]|nr:electron transport complex subunit D [Spirochaetia bacterium]